VANAAALRVLIEADLLADYDAAHLQAALSSIIDNFTHQDPIVRLGNARAFGVLVELKLLPWPDPTHIADAYHQISDQGDPVLQSLIVTAHWARPDGLKPHAWKYFEILPHMVAEWARHHGWTPDSLHQLRELLNASAVYPYSHAVLETLRREARDNARLIRIEFWDGGDAHSTCPEGMRRIIKAAGVLLQVPGADTSGPPIPTGPPPADDAAPVLLDERQITAWGARRSQPLGRTVLWDAPGRITGRCQ
jgi:hypothetical protein